MLSNNSFNVQQSGRNYCPEETAIETLSFLQTNPFNPISPSKDKRSTRRRDGHTLLSKKMYDNVKDDAFVFGFSPEMGDTVPPTSDEERSPRMKRNSVPFSVESCKCKMCLGEFPAAPEHATWKEVLHCTFRVMSVYYCKQYFSMKTEIVPFIESHWFKMWGPSKEKQLNWQATVSMIMSKYSQIFKSGSQEMGGSGYWGLGTFDVQKLENELQSYAYSQPQNKKRVRQDTRESAPPAPKKLRTRDDNNMLTVLASVAFECFSIEKSNPLAFVPISDKSSTPEALSKTLQQEIQLLKGDISMLDKEVQAANIETQMLDAIQQTLDSTTCSIMKDIDGLRRDSAAQFNFNMSSIANRIITPEGMVTNCIPLSV